MEKGYTVHSSNFFEGPPHYMIVWHAGTQYSIQMSLDDLIGTPFNSVYKSLLTELDERDDLGLPKRSPFKIIEGLQDLVWKACVPVYESHAGTEHSEPGSLQDFIQPPTLHVAIVRSAHDESGVNAEVIGDRSSNYPWDIARIAQTNSYITNSYGWDTAPVSRQDLRIDLAVQTFHASELFVTTETTKAGLMQQVRSASGAKFFFKPRWDLMAPEFDREISVLDAILRFGSDKTLKVSPFKGLVIVDNGLVAGMLFEWLEGWPLAEHPQLSDLKSHKLWQEQVEATVNELHRHQIIWGDVNVHNIFIDTNADAWVIDFGGNCNVEFVDEELKETYEGDIQGLRRVFGEWITAAGQS